MCSAHGLHKQLITAVKNDPLPAQVVSWKRRTQLPVKSELIHHPDAINWRLGRSISAQFPSLVIAVCGSAQDIEAEHQLYRQHAVIEPLSLEQWRIHRRVHSAIEDEQISQAPHIRH